MVDSYTTNYVPSTSQEVIYCRTIAAVASRVHVVVRPLFRISGDNILSVFARDTSQEPKEIGLG